jgi:hypothetical protein
MAELPGDLAITAVETMRSYARDVNVAIAAWLFSPALADVVRAFDGTPPPPDTPLGQALEWLEDFSLRWDYRRGKERNLVAPQNLGPDVEEVVVRTAAALGLVGTTAPPRQHYDHVLVLGGLVRACIARPLYAAHLLGDGAITVGAITALAGFRELRGDEIELAARFGFGRLPDEFAAMDAGVRRAFALDEPAHERGERSDVVGASWAVREYRADGPSVRVVAAPSKKPGERRANTEDTYRWFASDLVDLRGGETLLIVTSDIYVPYQHADALRVLALPHSVEVDGAGVVPGDADAALAQTFQPHNYLQEIRSTIIALRRLHEASLER